MRLDVGLLKAEIGRQESVPLRLRLDPTDGGDDVLAFPQDFVGQADAVSTDEGIVIRFALAGTAQLRCARCLGTFDLPVAVRFAELFREGAPRGEHGDIEADEDDGTACIRYQGDTIELDDLVRQNVLLELPMKPLCAPGCQGLCPRCGRNLNEGPCACAPEATDPRWRKLEDMQGKLDDSGDA